MEMPMIGRPMVVSFSRVKFCPSKNPIIAKAISVRIGNQS